MKIEAFGSLTKKIIIMGLIVIIAGVAFINWLMLNPSFASNTLIASLLWMITILLVIGAALVDEVNLELKSIYKEQTEEIKLLRAELNLLRFDFGKLFEQTPKKKK